MDEIENVRTGIIEYARKVMDMCPLWDISNFFSHGFRIFSPKEHVVAKELKIIENIDIEIGNMRIINNTGFGRDTILTIDGVNHNAYENKLFEINLKVNCEGIVTLETKKYVEV